MRENAITGCFNKDVKAEVTAPGLCRKVLAFCDEAMVIENTFKEGAIGSMHSHPHTQITYVAKGVFRFTIGEETYVVKAGDTIIPEKMILQDYPDEMVPFEHRNTCKNPQKTVLTHFSNDEFLYRRLRHIDEDIEICKSYMGVAGFDLSPHLGWNIEQQKFNLLINQMVNAYIAIHGVKILPNFRIGDISTISALDSFPSNGLYAVGALGCSKGYTSINSAYLTTKLLYKRPDGLLVYGKLMPQYKSVLDDFGIPYRVYEDFKSTCYSRRKVS